MNSKDNYVSYWNEAHKKYSKDKLTYDDWLDKYKDILDKTSKTILDLGCGEGSDSLYLTERGFKVLSVDYSPVALELVRKNVKGAKTALIDLTEPLPFEDDSFEVIIADLSLHYFDSETTFKIMKELKRILVKDGYLLARVNSTLDINYGANKGELIDPNYYLVNGYKKRFFDLEDTKKYFGFLGEVKANNSTLTKYSLSKEVIEIEVRNNKR